jgi:hypothetical protein
MKLGPYYILKEHPTAVIQYPTFYVYKRVIGIIYKRYLIDTHELLSEVSKRLNDDITYGPSVLGPNLNRYISYLHSRFKGAEYWKQLNHLCFMDTK